MGSTAIQDFLFALVDGLKPLFNCERATLFSIDRNKREVFSKNFSRIGAVKEIRVPVSNKSILGYVAATGKSLNIKDAYDEKELKAKCPGFTHDKSWDELLSFTTGSLLAVPIGHQGKIVGVIQFLNSFSEEGFNGLPSEWASISSTLGSALYRIEKEDLKEKSNKVIRMLDQAEHIDNIILGLEQELLTLFEIEMVTIYAIDRIENQLYSKLKSGVKTTTIRLPISEESIAGYVALSKQPVNIENVYDSEELNRINPKLKFNSQYDLKANTKSSSMLVYPLIDRGELLGVVQLVNKKYIKVFTSDDEGMLAEIVKIMSSSLRSQIYKKENKRKNIFQSLINSGHITESELEECYSIAHKEKSDVEAVLLKKGFAGKNLGMALEIHYSLPYQNFDQSFKFADCAAQKGLNCKYFLSNHCIPLQKPDSELKGDPEIIVVINNPENIETIESIKKIFAKRKVEFRVGLKIDIENFISHLIPSDMPDDGKVFEIKDEVLSSLRTESMSNIVSAIEKETTQNPDIINTQIYKGNAKKSEVKENFSSIMDNLEEKFPVSYEFEAEQKGINFISDSDSGVIRLVNKILTDANDQGASDIHIEPGIEKEPIKIRFRKDGRCFVYQEVPFQYKRSIVSRIKIMARLDIAERRFPQDGKIKLQYGSKKIEYRVATVPTAGQNEDAILRVLASSKPIPLDKMGFAKRNLDLIKQEIKKPYGLILVVGPTGSGKTTTLHSCLGEINHPDIKIWTAEDPIEITQKGLRQVQIEKNIDFDFADAMKTFLRGDPDVIMVGEMRDQKTCSIGLQASLTGHLVFSTLHTNSAPETIVRLVDLGMNPLNFADALLLIVAQRLVRTLCSECKEDYHPSQEEFDILAKEYGEGEFKNLNIEYHENLMLKKPVGCSSCKNTGYSGRMGLQELLHGSDGMKRLIMSNGKVEDIRRQAKADGMITLKQDGILKIFDGHCDLRGVLTVCTV